MYGKPDWRTNLWDKCKIFFIPGWIQPKPVYAAAGMLILAGALLFIVAVSLDSKSENMPVNPMIEAASEPIGPSPSSIESNVAPIEAAKPMPVAATATAPAAAKEAVTWPLKGKIQQEIGWKLHPVFMDWRYHTGLDIQAQEEQPVQAMLTGKVDEVYMDQNTGLTVVVSSGKYRVFYGSLGTAVVSKNDQVSVGSRIGTPGSCTAEPYVHLHLAVKKGDEWIDPREVKSN